MGSWLIWKTPLRERSRLSTTNIVVARRTTSSQFPGRAAMVRDPAGKTHCGQGDDRSGEKQEGHAFRHPILESMHSLAMERPFVVQRPHHAFHAPHVRIAQGFIPHHLPQLAVEFLGADDGFLHRDEILARIKERQPRVHHLTQ